MKIGRSWFFAFILAGLATVGFAQKIKVGYDKSADFSKFKTYAWAKPDVPIARPLLYQNVIDQIDGDLKGKGLQRIEKDGDLTVIIAGGIGIGYNMPPAFEMNVAYWSGRDDPGLLTAPMVSEGSLILEFVNRSANKMIWRGSVKENLDPAVAKSLPRIEKAIDKLLKEYPPKRSK